MVESLSIIVPVFNDSAGIRATVTSLLEQATQGVVDSIAIVDNGSTDTTPEVIQELADQHELVEPITESEIQSSYAARNAGIEQTSSELLAFVDADMTVSDDWLEHGITQIERQDAVYMGCNVELSLPDNPSIAARYDWHTGFPVEQYIEHQGFAPTCCLFVRRSVFESVGLFDPRLQSGGDKEFGNRVIDAGYTLHFAPDATMYHPTRDSMAELIKKDLRVGRGLCQLQRYHRGRFGSPGIPPRPSGVKNPTDELPLDKRLLYGSLSKFLTGVRGIGYYQEFVFPSAAPDIDEPPQLE